MELQIMPGLDKPAPRPAEDRESRQRRRKKRRRRRMWRKIRAWAARIAVAALLLWLVFQGGKFLVQKIQGKSTESFSEEESADFPVAEDAPVIVLDAGHGGNDQGTHEGRLLEKDINLEVVKLIEKELKKDGRFRVLLTRDDDRRVELAKRCELANEKDAAVFVSIHCNYCEESSKVEGTECYYADGSAGGKTLAEEVSRKFDETGGIVNRGVKTEDFHVLRETDMPAVLVELGYFSNRSEYEKLGRKSYRELLAKCIAEAILDSELLAAGTAGGLDTSYHE